MRQLLGISRHGMTVHLVACGVGYRWSELQIPPRHAGTGRDDKEEVWGVPFGDRSTARRDRLHGSQVSKARPGAPFDFFPGEKLVIPHLTRLRRHQRMLYKGEVKWGNLKLLSRNPGIDGRS
jgi:hypothetical protein